MNDCSLQERLRSASSAVAFESSSTDGFCQKLGTCLSDVIKACGQKSAGVFFYNAAHISHVLTRAIDWQAICQDHDNSSHAQSESTSSTDEENNLQHFSSPLQVLMRQLTDPRTFPTALASTVLQVLVRAYLLHSSSPSRSNHAETLLLQTVHHIMKRRQYREELGIIIVRVYHADFFKTDATFRVRNSILSLIKYLTQEMESIKCRDGYCPTVALLPCLLTIMQSLLSEEWIPSENDETPYHRYCNACGINKELRLLAEHRRKRVVCADMAVLHGEVDDDNGDAEKDRPRPRSLHCGKPVTLKSVIQARDHYFEDSSHAAPCPNCRHVAAAHDATKSNETRLKQWYQLRDKYIHFMISTFQSTKFMPQRKPYCLLQAVLSESFHNPYRRLCVLQLAGMLGARGYRYLVSSLWNHAQQKDINYYTWYAELIVESTFCDERAQCWEAMQPLVHYVKNQCQQDDDHKSLTDTPVPNLVTKLLPLLGYILSRRQRLLRSNENDDIHQEFASFVQFLSWAFGELNDWNLSPEATAEAVDSETEQQIIRTLQSLGIVSAFSILSEDIRRDECEESIEDDDDDAVSAALPPLSLPDAKGLRRAYQRMTFLPSISVAPCLDYDGSPLYKLDPRLVSNINHDKKQVPWSETKTEDAIVPPDVSPGTPPLRYLDNDVLRNIFSFLGYKKLIKLRTVCRDWKEITDEDRFWKPLYEKRFGLMGYDESKENDTKTVKATTEATAALWKSPFISKWFAQRQIRFKFNHKREYKFRICRHFDCHHVLSSPYRENQHYEKHKRQKALEEQREAKRKAKEIAKQAIKAQGTNASSRKRKASSPAAVEAKAKKPITLLPEKKAGLINRASETRVTIN